MKVFLFLILFLGYCCVFAFDCASEQKELSAQVCFERFESNGAINAHQMEIMIGKDQTLSLNGGQAACVFLRPGKYVFKIQGCKGYEIECKEWSSEEYSFTVQKGDSVKYEVYPTYNDHGYDGFFAAKRIPKK